MAKGIVSYPKEQREQVVSRRLAGNTGGLGYLAAKDAEEGKLRNQLIAKGLIKPQGKEGQA